MTEVGGAEYLRRLKQDLQPHTSQRADSSPEHTPGRTERRSVPRYRCMGSAQVRAQNSDVYTWASITDISLHGCYLEMAAAFPVGTVVFLQVELAHFRVVLKGEVRVTYPFLGMGVAFREVSEADRKQLSEIVRAVATELRLAVPQLDRLESLPIMPEVSDPNRALELLRSFFTTRKVLTRNEFAEILAAVSKTIELPTTRPKT